MHDARFHRRVLLIAGVMAAAWCIGLGPAWAQNDPPPSWNDGTTQRFITDFVTRLTSQGGTDFIPASERIATFDNDGPPWCAQPVYFHLALIRIVPDVAGDAHHPPGAAPGRSQS